MSDDNAQGLMIAACLRFTVDVEEVGVDAATGAPVLDTASCQINDFDKNGIEAALQLVDRHGGRVVGLSLVSERPPDDVLLEGLAMGLSELCLVCDAAAGGSDALGTAVVLGAMVRKLGHVDLVVCSDTSVDEYRGEVGPRLAEALGLPSVMYVVDLSYDGSHLRADRALESATETVEVPLPALVTVGSETNQPRMPTLRQIKQAVTKPVVEWDIADLPGAGEVCATSALRIGTLATFAPPSVRKRVVVEGESAADQARTLMRELLQDAALRL